MLTEADERLIQEAWQRADDMRPYRHLLDVVAAITPNGGDWECEEGVPARTIVWKGNDVSIVDPYDHIGDIDGNIAMALCAMPVMDKALRVILALAQGGLGGIDHDRARELIGIVAESAIAHAEQPAPKQVSLMASSMHRKIEDPDKFRDEVQELLKTACNDLDISCYQDALGQLEIAIEWVRQLIDWERTH